MKKEELKEKLRTLPLFRFIGFTQSAFVLILISSPFVWIWKDSYLSFKMFLTGLIGILVSKFIYWVSKEAVDRIIDQYEEPEEKSEPISQPISQEQKNLIALVNQRIMSKPTNEEMMLENKCGASWQLITDGSLGKLQCRHCGICVINGGTPKCLKK